MPKMRMTVTANVPKEVTREQFAWYVQEAVGVWKGQMSPEEPLFYLESDSVVVRDETGGAEYHD